MQAAVLRGARAHGRGLGVRPRAGRGRRGQVRQLQGSALRKASYGTQAVQGILNLNRDTDQSKPQNSTFKREVLLQELEPMDPWDEDKMLDATEDGPVCPQINQMFGRIPLHIQGMSEDCATLNIHVPYRSLPRFPWPMTEHGLPILVFIHGGAYQSGDGLTDGLGPEYLMMRDIIIITFNYRYVIGI